ncbi:RING-box protein 2 [Alligator sinensis]|uniref:cullin-RING-type E3 NEDD8 transferase n=1 Tax=Alligator sinensis TaxID=38654 RepID=A0A3Q0H1H2_ALLSI|nr:RING-box protein 2 [Alligator sinensis]
MMEIFFFFLLQVIYYVIRLTGTVVSLADNSETVDRVDDVEDGQSEPYACLRCQAENKQEDCVVVWGECNHSFHNCCMSLWVKQNNRCPLCQQDWVVQRIGK